MEELEGKIFGKSKKELEELIKEIVAITSKNQDELSENEKLLLDETSPENISKILIKYYDEHINSDIQKELSEVFVDGGMEKLQERELEQKQKEILDDVELPEGVDEKTKKEAIERLESEGKTGEELDEVNLKSELYKAVYERVFDEYRTLMDRCQKAQAKEGSLTIGDKEGTKLIIYERYLTRLEKANHNVGGEAFSKDSRISEMREEFENSFNENQKRIDEVTGKSIQELKKLYEKKKEIAEEIEYYEANPKLTTPEKMKSLRESYYDVAFEIRSQEPSLREYEKQMDIKDRNEEFSNREGVKFNSATDRNIAGSAYDSEGEQALDSYKTKDLEDESKNTLEDNEKDVEEIRETEDYLNEKRKEAFIKEYNKAMAMGDILAVKKLCEEYAQYINVKEVVLGFEKSKVVEGKIKYDEYKGKVKEGINIPGLEYVNSDEEIAAEEAKDNSKEVADEAIKANDEVEKDLGMERTIWNNKRGH